MKKSILIIFLTLISTAVDAQDFNIVGNWKVKEIITPKAVDNENIRNMMEGFREGVFHLKNDQSIAITSTNPTQGFRYLTMMANDAVWNYKDNIITLSDKKSKGLIMKIFVSIKEGRTIFTFDETNLGLEVVKKD